MPSIALTEPFLMSLIALEDNRIRALAQLGRDAVLVQVFPAQSHLRCFEQFSRTI